jgi:hypothetical protein
MLVLLLLTLLVRVNVALIGYTFATHRFYDGECWEDVAGLMALVMNSLPSEKLLGTTAEVKRSET